MKFYSSLTNGFYGENYSGLLPEQTVSISDDEWRGFLKAQSDGYIIRPRSDGYPEAVPPTITVLAEAQKRVSDEVRMRLDSGVQAWGYSNLLTALSYLSSSVTVWAEEAALFQKWRDDVWTWALLKIDTALIDGEPLDLEAFMVDMPPAPKRPKRK
jgi:hypothetical protein